ncbi:hypothetical protein Tco_1485731 [Tanacetum coccineum]
MGETSLNQIDEGPFQMGTFRETLAEGDEGALHLGPERPRVYSDLSPEDKDRTAGLWGSSERVGILYPGQARQDKMFHAKLKRMAVALDEEQLLFLAGGQDNVFDEDVDERPVQDLALTIRKMRLCLKRA